MKNKNSKISLIVGMAILFWSATIKATIVNIDALINTQNNPVTLFLEEITDFSILIYGITTRKVWSIIELI